MSKPKHDVEAVKGAARGRWAQILAALGGLEPSLLDGKNHPCPRPGCAGKDRFRFTNQDDDGSAYCNVCGKGMGDGFAVLRWLHGWTFPQTVDAVADHLGTATAGEPSATASNGKPRIVATYDYRDEQGNLLFQVVRMEPKDFRQRRPAAVRGRWIWGTKDVRMVPYRLPELLAHPADKLVVIVEGEKDVDRLAKIGITATTNPRGAGKWRAEYAEHFRGRRVIIIPDNDDVGRKHAQDVARSLHGIAAGVRIVELPGVPPKGDVSDWLDAGGTRENLAELADAAPDWTPGPDKTTKPAVGGVADEPHKPPPYVPFPTEALPAVVRDFIRQSAKALGCDESYVALPLLAALASAVGNSRRIRLKHSWCEPCIVWAVVVGESGTLKSPAFDLALSPLEKLQTMAFAAWRDEMDRYASDKATYEADLAEWKKRGRKNGVPPPEAPEEPAAVRYVCADTTVEALAVLLEQQPRGLLMARDELSGWVNSFDAYKACRGADVAHWLSMHRAGSLTVDRKTGRRVIRVPRAAVSIAGGVQPKALATALVGRYSPQEGGEVMAPSDREHFDNGLAARLMFAMPPRRPKRWTDEDLPPEAVEPIRALFDRLLSLDMGQDEAGEPVPVDLPLTADGRQAWVAFFNAHAIETAGMAGDLAAAWSKLEGYAARFALLTHLIRSVSGWVTPVDAAAVDRESIAAGVTLARWFADEAARVYAQIGGDQESPEAREQRELVRIIRDHGGEITVRQLMRASRKYRDSAELAEAALGRLACADLVTAYDVDPSKSGGRPSVVFVLLSSGDGDETPPILGNEEVLSPSPPDTKGELQLGRDACDGMAPQDNEVVEWTG